MSKVLPVFGLTVVVVNTFSSVLKTTFSVVAESSDAVEESVSFVEVGVFDKIDFVVSAIFSMETDPADDFDDVSFVEERVFDKVDVLTDEDILDDKFDSENTTELEFSRIFL